MYCVRRCKTKVKERTERRERLALRNEVQSEKHSEMYGGSSEGTGMKTYLHGLMDFAKTLKLRLRVCRGPGPARKKKGVLLRGAIVNRTKYC